MRDSPRFTAAVLAAATVLACIAPLAHAVTVGIGAYGGTSVSVIQHVRPMSRVTISP